MQKKLLMLFMVVHCGMIQAIIVGYGQAEYIDSLIFQYQTAHVSGQLGAVDGVYAQQKAENEKQRTDARCNQCNGRHIIQPDENSVTGRAHTAIEDEYNKKSEINNELYAGYKNNFGFSHELEHKIYMLQAVYLHALDTCGKDSSCLRQHDAPTWEEISKLGFMDERCSMVYFPVLYHGKIALTQEHKKQLAENSPEIKNLVSKLDEAKQAVQYKIDLLNK